MKLKPTLADIKQVFPREVVLLVLEPRSKAIKEKGWSGRTFADTQTQAYQAKLSRAINIGVLLGAASNNLCTLDWDTDPALEDSLERNPELRDSFRVHGNRAAQIYGYFEGARPTKVCALKVPADSPLAKGAKALEPGGQGADKNGMVKIGEFRAEGGQSVLVGIHPDSGGWYQWPCDNPPVVIHFERVKLHPDIQIVGWNDSEKNGDQSSESSNGDTPGQKDGLSHHDEEEASGEENALSKATRLVTIDQLWKHFEFPDRKGQNPVRSPFRDDDKEPSFSVYWKDGKQKFKDHGEEEFAGDSFEFYKLALWRTEGIKLEFYDACSRFLELAGVQEATRTQKVEVKGEFLEEETRETLEWYERKITSVPKPISEEAFIGFPGRWVQELEEQTECNRDNLLAQLAVGSGAMFGRYYYNHYGVDLYTNEFLKVLGDSGAKKGTALKKFLGFAGLIDSHWPIHGIGDSFPSGEAIVYAIRDQVIKIKGGKEVIQDAGVFDKRLLIAENELAQLYRMFERSGNTSTAKLRAAWDSPEVLSNRSKTLPAIATKPHISLIGHITIEELRSFDPNLISNGLLNRSVFVYAFKAREIPNPKPVKWSETLIEEFKEIYRLANIPTAIDAGQLGVSAEEVSSIHIPLDPEAEELWEKIYREQPANQDAALSDILRRYTEHIRKLALIYAIYDRVKTICSRHLLAAKAIMDHSKECVQTIFSAFTSNKGANKILEALKRQAPEGLAKSKIYEEVFNRHISASEINEALAFLVQNKLAIPKRYRTTPTAKKQTEIWYAIDPNRPD
jgi:hypothetical protein